MCTSVRNDSATCWLIKRAFIFRHQVYNSQHLASGAGTVHPSGSRLPRLMDRLEELTGSARLLELRRKMEEVKRNNDAEKRRLTVPSPIIT